MTDYISREAFLEQYRSLYCYDCDGRKNEKGKLVYEIGDAPCRACDIGDMLDAVEDFPAADVAPVRHGEWISVEDRLPEAGVPVLAVYIGCNTRELRNDLIVTISGGVWCYWECGPDGKCRVEITHWMPLPEPPGGDAT